jgi:hypothetical protein
VSGLDQPSLKVVELMSEQAQPYTYDQIAGLRSESTLPVHPEHRGCRASELKWLATLDAERAAHEATAERLIAAIREAYGYHAELATVRGLGATPGIEPLDGAQPEPRSRGPRLAAEVRRILAQIRSYPEFVLGRAQLEKALAEYDAGRG